MIEAFGGEPWQMSWGERVALEGVLSQLRPSFSIEIGTAEGGSLRRISSHSRETHSFDLIAPHPEIAGLPGVHLHTGDSHELLPAFLTDLAAAGGTVDFVLVDGDHTPDGVRQDLEHLLASEALQQTTLLIHDTLNDYVRAGLEQVRWREHTKVRVVDLDFIPGHFFYGQPFHHELWGGLGLVLVDATTTEPAQGDSDRFYGMFELLGPMRDVIVEYESSGGAVRPGQVADSGVTRSFLERPPAQGRDDLEAELHRTREALAAVKRSPSWRLTAPLRFAKRRLRTPTQDG